MRCVLLQVTNLKIKKRFVIKNVLFCLYFSTSSMVTGSSLASPTQSPFLASIEAPVAVDATKAPSVGFFSR